MSPAGPEWPRPRVLWMLWSLLVVLLSPWRMWAVKNTQECAWQVVLNKFKMIGNNEGSDRFFDQEPVDTVGSVFHLLVDAPIDPDEKYLGFPYYLKINYSCKGESPVNFNHWKLEQLQIQMEAVPFRSKGFR
uniref:Cation channel sperm associated auxiliary subunit gamma n=1 Tax=Molossus molossus TaxID=27622 RepID=A0A7J8C5Z1_MOLMO|nr:cation channel sperm associated auxiliary subunit gamma [Molossus molossus]